MDIAVQYCASFGCGDSSEWIESEMELITPQEEEGYRKMRCLNLELGEVAQRVAQEMNIEGYLDEDE